MNFELMSIVPALVIMNWLNQHGYTQKLEQTWESVSQWVWSQWHFHPDVRSMKATVSQNGNLVSRRLVEMGTSSWERLNTMTDFEFKLLIWVTVAALYTGMFVYYLSQKPKVVSAETEKPTKEYRMWSHVEGMEPTRRRPVTRSQTRQDV